jgi:hypothetical protein
MIFMVSLADHLCPALRTGPVDAALASDMWFSVSALGVRADTVAARTRAGFIAAASAASTSFTLTATILPVSAAQYSIHQFGLLVFPVCCMGIAVDCPYAKRLRNGLLQRNLVDALLDGIELRFQPLCLGIEVSSFLLWCQCCPTRDSGGKETMPPAASAASTSESEPASAHDGLVCETGRGVGIAVAQAAPGS